MDFERNASYVLEMLQNLCQLYLTNETEPWSEGNQSLSSSATSIPSTHSGLDIDLRSLCSLGDGQMLGPIDLDSIERAKILKYGLIIAAYSLIVVVSSIGNFFVCFIVFSQRRMRTTVNVFIANLALSDLVMTLFNIPFNCARLLMTEWVFGETLCHLVPFVQATSVYVSTLTMTFITVDRYQAIVRPLKFRLSTKIPFWVTVALIWTIAAFFSLPFALFNRITQIYTFRSLTRCRVVYPEPEDVYRKGINVATFVCQYAVPLSVISILYARIAFKIWSRETIGVTTEEQQTRQLKAKRKTVLMLVLVAAVFAICWLPLNIYFLLIDFAGIGHSFNALIGCHWMAMSSVMYNPFIYFSLNKRFQQMLRSPFICCSPRTPPSSSGLNCSNTQLTVTSNLMNTQHSVNTRLSVCGKNKSSPGVDTTQL